MTTPLPKDASLLSKEAVDYLMALGWYSDPTDRRELLYPPLTPAQKANASLSKIGNLYINGEELRATITDVLTDARHEQDIDGTNTVTLDMFDDDLKLLRSGIFSRRSTLRLDGLDYETVQVRKSGSSLSVTFEDLGAALLRKRDEPFKVAANTTNHVVFVRRMVEEVPRLKFWHPPDKFMPKGTAPTELARGNPATREREDSWTAIHRIGLERGWRFFLRGDQAIYTPEPYLLSQNTRWNMTQGKNGVEYIDFDFDNGKPTAVLRARVRAARWQVRVGEPVHVHDMGPADGRWMVISVARSLFDIHADIRLGKPHPILPEPKPSDTTTAGTGAGAATATFGDGRRRTYNLGAVKPHVRDAAIELGSRFSVDKVGGVGARPNASDHPSGYALDFFVDRARGDALVQYAIDNASRLKVKYILWQQAIWKPNTRRFERMADRGNATANHFDHVHISFNR